MKQPWHVDFKPVSADTWEGYDELTPRVLHRKVYNPLLDLTTYSTLNPDGSWSLYLTIRSD